MKTKRVVLTYTGEGTMPIGDVKQLREQVAVLDRRRHSLLIEDTPEHLSRLLQTMPQWQAGPEAPSQGSWFPVGIHHRLWVLILIVMGLLIYFTLSCQR